MQPDGQQTMECKIDKVKIFVRPFVFLRLVHFFAEGTPEYEKPTDVPQDGNTIGEWPNSWETDLEKMPALKVKVEVLDSLLCLDSFDSADLIDLHMN